MTTLDVLKGIQRIMIEKLIAKSDIIISVTSRPERSELSIYVQNTDYVVLAHEIFMTIPGLTLKKKIERRTFESGKQSISIQEYLSLHNIAT